MIGVTWGSIDAVVSPTGLLVTPLCECGRRFDSCGALMAAYTFFFWFDCTTTMSSPCHGAIRLDPSDQPWDSVHDCSRCVAADSGCQDMHRECGLFPKPENVTFHNFHNQFRVDCMKSRNYDAEGSHCNQSIVTTFDSDPEDIPTGSGLGTSDKDITRLWKDYK